jgi:hypothetical protein
MAVNHNVNINVKTKGADRAKRQITGVSSSMKNLAKNAVIAGGAFFGAQALLGGLKKSVQLAGEQEAAEKKLSVAYGGNIDALKKYAAQLQQVTAYGDEVTIGAMSRIAAFVKDETQLKAATKASQDMAAALGMDLVQAADLVAKTLGSSMNALSRYGVQVEGTVGSTERLEAVTQGITNLWGGQAEAAAETMTGQLQQMHNAVGDAGEAIGELLAPAIIGVAGSIQDASEWLGKFFGGLGDSALEQGIKRIEELGEAFAPLASLKRLQAQRDLITATREQVELEADLGLSFETAADAQDHLKGLSKQIALEQVKIASAIERQATGQSSIWDTGSMTASEYQEKWEKVEESSTNHLTELLDQVDAVGELVIKLAEVKVLTDTISAPAPEQSSDASIEAERERIDAIENMRVEEGETLAEWAEFKHGLVEVEIEDVKRVNNTEEMAAAAKQIRMKQERKTLKEQGAMGAAAILEAVGFAKAAAGVEASMAVVNAWSAAVEVEKNATKMMMVPPAPQILAGIQLGAGLAKAAQVAKAANYFAEGGYVGGSGAGDSVRANLTAGEYVMTRSAVDALGVETLDELNAGGGGGVTLNIAGNILGTEEFVRDTLLPEIEKTLAGGLA